MKSLHRQAAGFSLMELMVALVLGLIVAGAAIAIFSANRKTYAATESLGRTQEGVRTAFELMGRDLRAAGSSDESGGGDTNARVRGLRARWLALALAAHGIVDVGEGDASRNPDPTQRSAGIHASIGGAR